MRACRTLIKTQDYLDVFARFKNTENITAVERVLGAHPQLEPFEKSQLGMTPLIFSYKVFLGTEGLMVPGAQRVYVARVLKRRRR